MNNSKYVIFAFQGNPVCFIHVLLNALDLHSHGQGGDIVLEGAAIKLIPEISQPGHPLYANYKKVKELGLFKTVCKACAVKLKLADAAQNAGLPLSGDMSGHPAMSSYIKQGYTIITM